MAIAKPSPYAAGPISTMVPNSEIPNISQNALSEAKTSNPRFFCQRTSPSLSTLRSSTAFTIAKLFLVAVLLMVASPALAQGADQWTASDILISARICERLLIVLSGILLLFLGYRLFSKVAELGDLTAEVPERIKLQMQRVGPGVFFALFGSFILSYAMMSEISIGGGIVASPVTTPTINFGLPTLAGLTKEQSAAKTVYHIEKLKEYAISQVKIRDATAQKELNDAVQVATSLQQSYIDDLIGKGSYYDWQNFTNQLQSDPTLESKLSSDRKKKYERISQIIEEGEI